MKRLFHQSSTSRRLGMTIELVRFIRSSTLRMVKPWTRAKELSRSARRKNKWGKVDGCKLAKYRAQRMSFEVEVREEQAK
jgi:hypothetical protein